MAKVSIQEFEKAVTALNIALTAPKNDITRDASIQRYEFCIELAWKVSKKVMGTNSASPKSVIREMAQDNLIQDAVLWLKAVDYRNLSAHTYDQALAEEVYQFALGFLPELFKLVKRLK